MARHSHKSDDLRRLDKDLKQAPLPPLPFNQSISENEEKKIQDEIRKISQKEGPLTVDEALKLIEEVEKKEARYMKKLEETFSITTRECYPEYLKRYMSNPKYFPPEERRIFKQQCEALINSLNLPPELIKSITTLLDEAPNSSSEKTTLKDSSKQRGKMGHARRRNWLFIR